MSCVHNLCGLYGVVFYDTAQVAQTLRNLISDPVKGEQAFLLNKMESSENDFNSILL
jgi:hypothetical protein